MVADPFNGLLQSSSPEYVTVIVPPAQSVQFRVTVPGIVPLFSHGPVKPLVYVAAGTVVYADAAAQSKVDGSVGSVIVAGGAGVTVIVAVPVKGLLQSSTPV